MVRDEDGGSTGGGTIEDVVRDAAKDVEQLMEKITSTNIGKGNVLPKKSKKLEVEDCLDAAEKTTHTHPTYVRRTPSPQCKGLSFGTPTSKSDPSKRFVSPALSKHVNQGIDGPGPAYNPPSFTDRPTKPQSFPKAPRSRDASKSRAADATPGPKYEVPGSMGKQMTRTSAPGFKMGQSQRFTNTEYISGQHSRQTTSKDSPAPNAYSPDIPATAPAYSFSSGGRDLKRGKVFLSKEHAQHDSVGMASPGPMYSWASNTVKTREPAYSFGVSDRTGPPLRAHSTPPDLGGSTGAGGSLSGSMKSGRRARFISREHAKEDRGRDSPGPGTYTPDPGVSGPSYSFGTPSENPSATRNLSRGLEAAGRESPGPQYHPIESSTRRRTPAAVFANPDPLAAYGASRFNEKQFLSQSIAQADLAGRESPGPGTYDVARAKNDAPAFTMGRRERVLMKRICPAPERARFFSKELARENTGAYSPGPKYKLPDGIGGMHTVKYTFGTSDRAFEDVTLELKDKIGTVDKPYTAPSEARYVSKQQMKSIMAGKFSPGPLYTPNMDSVLRVAPKHSLGAKWKVPAQDNPTKAEREEERKKALKQPGKDPRVKVAPTMKFGTSVRGLLPGEEAKAKKVAAGRDSPGPVYRPNFEAVDAKVKGVSLGGLH